MRRAVCNTMPNKFLAISLGTNTHTRLLCTCGWMGFCVSCRCVSAANVIFMTLAQTKNPCQLQVLRSSGEKELVSERTRMNGQGKNIYGEKKREVFVSYEASLEKLSLSSASFVVAFVVVWTLV